MCGFWDTVRPASVDESELEPQAVVDDYAEDEIEAVPARSRAAGLLIGLGTDAD